MVVETASEQSTFVFSITFLLILGALIATIPAGMQGAEETATSLSDIDPSLITGFSESEWFVRANFTIFQYEYELAGDTWLALANDDEFALARKIYFFGLWLGGYDQVNFISGSGINRGLELSFAEIEADAENGTETYTLVYEESGASAGSFLVYWDEDSYYNSTTAWLDDALYCVHGFGISSTAVIDIGTLLIALLLFQLPDTPPIVGILLGTSVWACIVYLLWFIFKESLPFV